ncbi:CheA signal transduction histidine kinase [Crinalium epipsammum PCC 9333]|uniref:histidine kinase n=1 Tax=Crinalium epipsammum PCC 9333 TaxID=1173022 RepID=K9VYT4_9CYAN|nr:hybrid sensor histidine kinase/response regulator [Crinalium epipsammum]AFZ13111.1 CheA signal transduction histidine kinase [Crinalium epipsammum PCC 9333]
MFIDDDEMRQIFKDVSEERLQKLDEGLLLLEKNASDEGKFNDLLREAHSLKGDANMLGVTDVGTLAHRMEDILASVKRGDIKLTPEISDRLYQALDAIRKLVHEAVTGEASRIDLSQTLAHLAGATVPEKTSKAIPADSKLIVTPALVETVAANPPIEVVEISNTLEHHLSSEPVIEPIQNLPIVEPISINASVNNNHITNQASAKVPNQIISESDKQEVASTGTYKIETIRVETNKLDTLMTQAGELTVSKIRIAHRLSEIEEIVALWEDWSRDAFVNRFAFQESDRSESQSYLNRNNSQTTTTIQNYHHRSEERLEKLGNLLNSLRGATSEDNARLETVATELEEGIRTLRLLPLSNIFNLFSRMVRDLAKQQDKEVNLIIEGGDTRADKRILEEMKDPLMHMIRNAIDHGIETTAEREKLGKPRTATLRLKGYQTASSIGIELIDDGRGLDIESIKQTAVKRGINRPEDLATMTPAQIHALIFAPGFSTRTFVTEVSGRGVGLDVVRTNVERLKGTIQVESTPGKGTTFRLQLASTLATAHVLIVEVDNISYAIPVEFVDTTLLVKQHDIFSIEGRDTLLLDSQPVSMVWLSDMLEISSTVVSKNLTDSQQLPCIILKVGQERLGVIVNALLDEQDVVLKPQSKLLKRVRNISGATILGTGEVCMVLNPQDLLKSVRGKTVSVSPQISVGQVTAKQKILLVEDSITIRTQEKRILESAGYEVVTAVDGLDGYDKLRVNYFDAVISDVEMPRLDGLSLTAKIRQHKEFSEIPVILVTSLAKDEDKKRGAEAGANAYITKGNFNQQLLIDTLRRLV